MTLMYILFGLIVFCFLMSITDVLPKRNWFRRVATVSKLHQCWISIIALIGMFLIEEKMPLLIWSGVCMSLVIIINNGWSLRRYMPYYPKRIQDGTKQDVKVFSLNVRQKNKNYTRTLKSIKDANADILALTETDPGWAEALLKLDVEYKHHVKVPLDNTYGMILYSKFPIIHYEIKYLTSEEIPSIHSKLNVNGQEIHLILIHPEPPIDFKSLKGKDLEILKVTVEANDTDIPTILCGDLNDVGWSYASRHMCEQAQLEDPRIGRGFFNTYNALIPLFRYPIDHFFMSPKLKVVSMKVLKKCGSDHFPVSICIELPTAENN